MSKDAKNDAPLVVAYHADCIDGLACAWGVHKKFPGRETIYVPISHHDHEAGEKAVLAALKPGSELFYVDAAPERAFLDKLANLNLHAITVIDHHLSTHKDLSGYVPPAGSSTVVKIITNDDHPSAASMVWDYLLGSASKPEILTMIEKMDVKPDLRSEQDYAAAAFVDSKSLRSIKDAFMTLDSLSSMSIIDMACEGGSLYKDQFNRVAKLHDNVMFTMHKGQMVPVVNADVQSFGRYISEYLRELARENKSGAAFAWYMQGNGVVTMSIRATGDTDASAIATDMNQKFGTEGGGHKTSAAVHFRSLAAFAQAILLLPRDAAAAKKPPMAHGHGHGHGNSHGHHH